MSYEAKNNDTTGIMITNINKRKGTKKIAAEAESVRKNIEVEHPNEENVINQEINTAGVKNKDVDRGIDQPRRKPNKRKLMQKNKEETVLRVTRAVWSLLVILVNDIGGIKRYT